MGFDPAFPSSANNVHSIASPTGAPSLSSSWGPLRLWRFREAIYDGLYKLTRRWRGPSQLPLLRPALFGAISVRPREHGDFRKLVCGNGQVHSTTGLRGGMLAICGHLRQHIPPSINFVIFALFTEQSIARLFAAGSFRIFTAWLMPSIFIRVRRNPISPPSGDPRKNCPSGKVECYKMMPIGIVILVTSRHLSADFQPTEALRQGA